MYVSCYFFYYLSILLSSFQQTDPCDKDKGILADAKPTEVRPYCTQIHNQCSTGSSVGPIKKTKITKKDKRRRRKPAKKQKKRKGQKGKSKRSKKRKSRKKRNKYHS